MEEHKSTEDELKQGNVIENENEKKGEQCDEARTNTKSRRIGFGIVGAQLVATVFFAYMVLELNILPTEYIIIMSVVLVVLWVAPFVGQYFSKKKGILVKVVSSILTIALFFGGFYVFQTSEAIAQITSQEVSIDSMVVVVRSGDFAETLEDVIDYTFGVQYATMAEETETTLEHIEGELGKAPMTQEYAGLTEQLFALIDGEIGAIIYNEAYSVMIEEVIPNYSDSVKIIHTYEIIEEVPIEEVVEEVIEEEEDDTFTVYISGIDVYGSISKTSRSDVNILATVNPTTHQILLTTTPRDYFVQIPEVSGESYDKLTHAGLYGVEASMATLGELYDTEIDYYVRVNFTSVVEMVDALGGIEVYSDSGFTAFNGLSFSKGMNQLSGREALTFARERKNLSGGDLTRGTNQQKVITAMIDKVLSPALLTGALDILASVSDNIDTDIPEELLQELVKTQLEEGGDWDITSISAEGTGAMSRECYSLWGNNLSVIKPDETSVEYIHESIEAVRDGEVVEEYNER